MRIIKQFQKENFHVSIFQWNGKILLKLEQPLLEITYKWSELDLASHEDVEQLLENEEFIKNNIHRFNEMREELSRIIF